MALNKQNLNINFSQGLETKVDPKQISPGKFLSLKNSVFGTQGLLKKRNGFKSLVSLPDDTSTTATTFNGNLLAVGERVLALSADSNQWVNSGSIQPLSLSVLPLVRSSSGQRTVDTVVASNGLSCSVWLDTDTKCYYQIADSVTGQIIASHIQLPATATMPRCFALGFYFIITYLATVGGTTHLQYLAIPINNPNSPGAATDFITQAKSLTAGYDGYVANNSLYVAVDGNAGGGEIRISYIDAQLNPHSITSIAAHSSDLMSVTADTSQVTPVIWITFWNSGNNNAYSTAYNPQLVSILAPTQTIFNQTLSEITSSANNMSLKIFADVNNTYSYAPNARSDYIETVNCTQSGTVTGLATILRSVGLASKAFYYSPTNKSYALATYGGSFQPTYFFIDELGNIIAKLDYSNGSGYGINQILPSVNVTGSLIQIGYLHKDLLTPVNKSQGVANVAGIYSQTGINLVSFNFTNISNTQEIGSNLNITGGLLWAYDGVKPVEQGFNVWPEDITTTPSASGGSMSDQQYFYSVTYEWTDAQGNIFRSAPSVPVGALVAGGGGSGSVTLKIPTLRLTYKVAPNTVRIVVYRWSTAQQSYYQTTSITSPLNNDTTTDSITFIDTNSDASILGNLLLYTTGGVIEDIAPPSFIDIALFKSRLFGISSEDPNLVWYSKQVIEATPVEMSDLFTIFIAPTTGAQGSTGSLACLCPMDDKMIFFKKNAIYYLTGNGPDNTGANNDFSEPIFITSTVGCANKKSIVFMPQGLMFQSDKGIWLLGRDLSTSYIGAPVEKYNSNKVLSALNIPGTNEVRFTLDNGITLMYDYFYGQWGEFEGIPSISSTLYQDLHTYINALGQVYQETPDLYLDGSNPVLMSFKTGWLNLAGLQGYERAYFFYLLGDFISPHKLQVQVSYDYSPNPSQSSIIIPDNYNNPLGLDSPLGSVSPLGGTASLEQWRVFFQDQKCQAFQISVSEIYDPFYGVTAGAGLTLSGLNLVFGLKKGYRPIMAKNTVG